MITAEEHLTVERARRLRREVIMVDDFDASLSRYDECLLERVVY